MKSARLSVKVGDLVRQKNYPQGVWVVTKIEACSEWFATDGFGPNVWKRTEDYEVISESR
jgi:hypothetical protein